MNEPQIVQVRIPGARRTYPYTWDGEPLEVGDWVDLPGNAMSPDGTEGRVEGFGADGYPGPMKAVVAVKEKQDPWMARMRQVKTAAERLQVYRRAQKAGITGERLSKLVELGKQVLDAAQRDEDRGNRAREAMRRAREQRAERRRTPDPDFDIPAAAGSIGRVDAGESQQERTDWGEWE